MSTPTLTPPRDAPSGPPHDPDHTPGTTGSPAARPPDAPAHASRGSDPNRWRALAVLSVLELVLILDITVVNVALPEVRAQLGFTSAGLAWVINGYLLMAGGLLLLGGRLADLLGRRRLLMAGVTVFGVGSLGAALAWSPESLVAARFVQGLGEALAAPAALGLVGVLFTEPAERVKALGIWGGIAGVGGTFGTILSGVLIDLADWRWVFLINVPVMVVVLVALPRLVSRDRRRRGEHTRLDGASAATVTLGMLAIVFGLLQAADHAWGSARVLVPLGAGIALLAALVPIERRSSDPLIPRRFFRDRVRIGANLAVIPSIGAFFSYMYMVSVIEQRGLGFTPLETGLGFLPMALGIGAGIGIASAIVPRVGLRTPIVIGLLGAGVGIWLAGQVDATSGYWSAILPPMLVFGLFSGLTMPPTMTACLHGTGERDASLASGVQGTTQQVGAALGLALLTTIAVRHAEAGIVGGAPVAAATIDGYALALQLGAVLYALSALVAIVLVPAAAGRGEPVSPGVLPTADAPR